MLSGHPAASPPPRHVPLRARCRLFFVSHGLLGHFVLFITLFLALIFILGPDPKYELLHDDSPRVTGQVTKSIFNPGSHKKGGGGTPHKYEYFYRYAVDGTQYTGSEFSELEGLDVVSVQYAAESPWISRVDAQRNRALPKTVLFIPGLFAALTVYLYLRALRDTTIDVRMAREGRLATATVARTRGPKGDEVALLFITAEGQAWQFRPRGDTSRLKNGQQHTLAYVPGRPPETRMLEWLDPPVRAFVA